MLSTLVAQSPFPQVPFPSKGYICIGPVQNSEQEKTKGRRKVQPRNLSLEDGVRLLAWARRHFPQP